MIYIKLLSCCLLATVIFDLTLQCLNDDPKVCLPDAGCYIGKSMDGYQIRKFQAFLGIPYASPANRFEPANRYVSNKTHTVKEEKPDCLQKNYLLPSKPITGSEDCLYLNLYRPILTDNQSNLNVMVYIYGGGFFAGTANPIMTGPEYIMDHGDVILVTFGYRLGAFGFLSTGDEVLPGNVGQKDQVMALTWVSDNIAYFGGDRLRVTLFGQSAGAVSAHMHMLSKMSQNLFYAVIAISGTANVPFGIDETPEHTFRQTARYSNITDWDTLNTTALVKLLQNAKANTVLHAGDHLKYWDIDNMVNYRPVIEKPGKNSFLDQHPDEFLQSGNYEAVPIMFGTVPNEGGVRVVAIMESDDLRERFNKNFYELMVKFLEFPSKFNTSQIDQKMDMILKEYFNGVKKLSNETKKGFMDLVTDRGFHHPLYNALKMFVDKKRTDLTPAFMYIFNYLGTYTYANVYAGHATGHEYGVVHRDDLIYLLRSPLIFPNIENNSTEANVIKNYVNDLVYFAQWRQPKSLQPFTPCNKSSFYPAEGKICQYQEFVNGDNGTLVIKLNDEFNTRRMKFWDNILK
ncbi:juvenile hormone esterase-like [Calliphora vicina]|uniref:juvenile hormone esterase-like n=1 Tax=Calliphora vicina TaxID=7373 RepID=UPI00325A84D6